MIMSPYSSNDVTKTAHTLLNWRPNCNFMYCRKMIYALYLSRKIIYTLFVAKTIYAVLLESFCALNFAIWKVQTFWASERAIDEIRGPIAKNELWGRRPKILPKKMSHFLPLTMFRPRPGNVVQRKKYRFTK